MKLLLMKLLLVKRSYLSYKLEFVFRGAQHSNVLWAFSQPININSWLNSVESIAWLIKLISSHSRVKLNTSLLQWWSYRLIIPVIHVSFYWWWLHCAIILYTKKIHILRSTSFKAPPTVHLIIFFGDNVVRWLRVLLKLVICYFFAEDLRLLFLNFFLFLLQIYLAINAPFWLAFIYLFRNDFVAFIISIICMWMHQHFL